MQVPVCRLSTARALDVVNAWSAFVANTLASRDGGRFEAVRTHDARAGSGDDVARHFVDLTARGRIHGRVRVEWRAEFPNRVDIAPDANGLPEAKHPLARVLEPVASTVAIIGGIVGLLFWFWWLWDAWASIWERLSNFGPGPGRANKLEVLWGFTGWALSPIIGAAAFGMPFFLLDSALTSLATRMQQRRVERLHSSEFAAAVDGIVAHAVSTLPGDPAAALRFGLFVAGAPHPALPNVVWDATGDVQPRDGFEWAGESGNAVRYKLAGQPVPGVENLVFDATGRYQPAPGFTWATDDINSLLVRPVE